MSGFNSQNTITKWWKRSQTKWIWFLSGEIAKSQQILRHVNKYETELLNFQGNYNFLKWWPHSCWWRKERKSQIQLASGILCKYETLSFLKILVFLFNKTKIFLYFSEIIYFYLLAFATFYRTVVPYDSL